MIAIIKLIKIAKKAGLILGVLASLVTIISYFEREKPQATANPQQAEVIVLQLPQIEKKLLKIIPEANSNRKTGSEDNVLESNSDKNKPTQDVDSISNSSLDSFKTNKISSNTTSQSQAAAPQLRQKTGVVANKTYLREKPYEEAKNVADMAPGDLVTISSEIKKGNWILVTHEKTGESGYLRRGIDFLEVGQ